MREETFSILMVGECFLKFKSYQLVVTAEPQKGWATLLPLLCRHE